jgi:thioesterase domain-containing protein
MNSGEFGPRTPERPVIFLFPGLSGDHKEIELLRTGCSASFCFVSIQLPDWSRIDYSLVSLDGLISHCMARIEADAPCGPVLLAGYSFGGHVAWAVAAALEASGRRVGCLALLDTSAVPPIEKAPISVGRPIGRLIHAIRVNRIGTEIGRIMGAIIIRIQNKTLSRFLARVTPLGLSRDMDERFALSISLTFNLPILEQVLDRLAKSNRSSTFPAVLFRCVEQAPGATEDLGWDRHLARLQVVPILGDHDSLTNPPNLPSLCASFIAVMSDMHVATDAPVD